MRARLLVLPVLLLWWWLPPALLDALDRPLLHLLALFLVGLVTALWLWVQGLSP